MVLDAGRSMRSRAYLSAPFSETLDTHRHEEEKLNLHRTTWQGMDQGLKLPQLYGRGSRKFYCFSYRNFMPCLFLLLITDQGPNVPGCQQPCQTQITAHYTALVFRWPSLLPQFVPYLLYVLTHYNIFHHFAQQLPSHSIQARVEKDHVYCSSISP